MFIVQTEVDNGFGRGSRIGPFETREAAEQALTAVLGTVSNRNTNAEKVVTGGSIVEVDED